MCYTIPKIVIIFSTICDLAYENAFVLVSSINDNTYCNNDSDDNNKDNYNNDNVTKQFILIKLLRISTTLGKKILEKKENAAMLSTF